MTSPKHTSSDLVERLRAFDYNVDIAMFYDKDPECVSEAADRIEALEAENKRLRGAISWIEPPFVDENTPAAELRSRIGFCIADAALAAMQEAKP